MLTGAAIARNGYFGMRNGNGECGVRNAECGVRISQTRRESAEPDLRNASLDSALRTPHSAFKRLALAT